MKQHPHLLSFAWSFVPALMLVCSGCFAPEPLGASSRPAAPAAPAPPPAPIDRERGKAPTPFTAKELRAATDAGRTWTYVVETPSELPMLRRVRVFAADDERLSYLAEMLDEQERPVGPPENVTKTWDELRLDASFDAASTRIDEATAETPAGSFAARRYRVVSNDGTSEIVTTSLYALELPGPPVETTIERDGVRVRTTTLLSHRPGGPASP